jgi:lipopolysaccharide transport system ATP-binding protein
MDNGRQLFWLSADLRFIGSASEKAKTLRMDAEDAWAQSIGKTGEGKMPERKAEDKEIAIQIQNVSKCYRLGQIGRGTLQADLQSWWANVRGREDPNQPLNAPRREAGQKFMALSDINLTVYRGEALGIIGGNGAGKSTLLKLLSRITAPTTGMIDLYGRVSSMLEVGTGFHGQLTGRENIYMNGAILGMTKAEIDRKLDSIVAFSGMEQFIDTPVKRYSSGMFVRLAFSVAAHLDSEILIMDEVLAVGDMAFQKKCLARMREAAGQEGRTVLYVSHNMNTIRDLCDRCIVLDKGQIIFDGDVETAIHLYLNSSSGERAVDMDLTAKSHVVSREEPVLAMKHLTLVGKMAPVYDGEEPLRMRFLLWVKKPLENVQLRLTLRTDTDEAIGTAWSVPVDFVPQGKEEVALDVSMRFDMLETGDYYVSIGFYQLDEFGRLHTLDHISRAFQIRVEPAHRKQFWQAGAYGYVRLPEILVEPAEGCGGSTDSLSPADEPCSRDSGERGGR